MELTKPNIFNAFPNPVFCFNANVLENEHQNLIEECMAWRRSSEGLRISNAGGWHSENTLFKRDEPNIKNLCNLFVNATNQVSLQISPSFPIEKYNLVAEGWVNIGSKFSFNYPHNHPGFSLSGIYYLKVTKKRKDSGLLQFLDPRGSIQPYSQGITELKTTFNDKFTVLPEEKTLIIFPSWLQHWVTPNLEEEERISVACNFRYQKK